MHFLIFAILGSIAVFFVVFCVLAGMDYVSTRLVRHEDRTKHAPAPKYARARKIILSAILGLVIIFLASALVYITYIVRFDTIEKKIETKNRDIAERVFDKKEEALPLPALPSLQNASSARDTSPSTEPENEGRPPAPASDGAEEATAETTAQEEADEHTDEATLFGNKFEPATEKIRREKKGSPPPAIDKKHATPFTVRDAQPGDIYILNYYDTLADGRFTKSDGVEFVPPSVKSDAATTVAISLPALAKGTERQLPILINGSIVHQYAGDGTFELEADGMLKAYAACRMTDFIYTMRRHPKGGTIRFGREDASWIEKETASIPPSIKETLDSVMVRTDTTKMGTVAAILNAYFGYQAGRKTVVRQDGLTWNDMLTDTIKKHERFSADCDVLATFAFIYLRYLEFRPALLLASIPENAHGTASMTGDVHATLYLRSGGEWILFEPTIFTTIDTPLDTLPSALPHESAAAMPGQAVPDVPGTEKTLEASRVSYFTLPQPLLEKFRETDHAHRPEGRLAQYMVDILCNDDSQQEKNSRMPEAPYMIVQFAISLFLLCSLLLKVFFVIQNEERKIFSMGRTTPIFLALLIITLGYLLIVSWKKSTPIPVAGLVMLMTGGITSVFGMLIRLHTIPANYAVLYPIRTFTLNSLYPFTGILFILGAIVITPHILTLLVFSLMMVTVGIYTMDFFRGRLHD